MKGRIWIGVLIGSTIGGIYSRTLGSRHVLLFVGLTQRRRRVCWIVDCLQDLLGACGVNGSTLRFISIWTRSAPRRPVICLRS